MLLLSGTYLLTQLNTVQGVTCALFLMTPPHGVHKAKLPKRQVM